MSSNKSIAKSAGVIGVATLISRILGFVRDILFAAFFGTGLYADAFVVAFRIPNLLRDLIGEGATNSAVVPVLVEELTHRGKEDFWRLANILLNIVLIVLSGLAVIGFIFSRPIVILIAPGFLQDVSKLDVTVALTKAIFPYIILIGLAAYGMGVLNSVKHFLTPAFGPSMLNISLILCLLIWRQDIIGLAVGVLLGGILQVIVQIPPLLKQGIIFSQREFVHSKVRRIGRLLIPRVFGSGIYQINIFVSTILASIGKIVGEGAVAALYFSNRILQFPLAIFAIALAQAALPTLSGHIAQKELNKFKDSINFQLRSISFILLPSSAGLMALTVPITKVLFERGEFGAWSTAMTSSALFFYSLGLLAFGAIKILVGAFYSMQDTMTPVKVALCSLIVNVILNIVFMYPLKIGGLAIATSISATVNAWALFIILRKRLGTLYEQRLLVSLSKIFFASLSTGLFVFLLNRYLERIFVVVRFSGAINLLSCIAAAFIFYIFLCYILQVEELKELKRWLLKKR